MLRCNCVTHTLSRVFISLFYPCASYFVPTRSAVSEFGKTISAIGLASTPTLDSSDPSFGWVDEGMVISTNASSSYNAIDPNIVFAVTGK